MAKNNTVTENEAYQIISLLKNGGTVQDAANKFKHSRCTIMNVRDGKQKLVKDTPKMERPKAVYSNRDFSVYA